MDRGLCIYCQCRPVSGSKRKYCEEHSRQASAIWKRRRRRFWQASGQKYWLDAWKNQTPEERKAYYREYMREYRRRTRGGTAGDLAERAAGACGPPRCYGCCRKACTESRRWCYNEAREDHDERATT